MRIVTRPLNGAGTRVVIWVITLVIVVVAGYLPGGWTMAGALTLAGLGCTLAGARHARAIGAGGPE